VRVRCSHKRARSRGLSDSGMLSMAEIERLYFFPSLPASLREDRSAPPPSFSAATASATTPTRPRTGSATVSPARASLTGQENVGAYMPMSVARPQPKRAAREPLGHDCYPGQGRRGRLRRRTGHNRVFLSPCPPATPCSHRNCDVAHIMCHMRLVDVIVRLLILSHPSLQFRLPNSGAASAGAVSASASSNATSAAAATAGGQGAGAGAGGPAQTAGSDQYVLPPQCPLLVDEADMIGGGGRGGSAIGAAGEGPGVFFSDGADGATLSAASGLGRGRGNVALSLLFAVRRMSRVAASRPKAKATIT